MASSGSFNTSNYDGRYLKFSWEVKSQSVANNTTTISWTLKGAGDAPDSWYTSGNFKVVIAGETVYSSSTRIHLYNGTKVASGTYTFTHNSDGTKSFSASAQAGIFYVAVNCTGSGTFTLPTIARASTFTISNGTLDTAQTLSITRYDSSFKHKITYTCGDTSGYIAGSTDGFSTATSVSWTPPISLASQNTTGTTVSITVYVKTYMSDGTQVGTVTKAITCSIPAKVKPSCSLTVSDATGHSTTYGAYIKGMSKLSVKVTATTSYSSPIASYSTTADGSTYNAATFQTDVLKSSGTLSIATTVKDKRGRTGTDSKSITVIDYEAPKIIKLTVKRCNSDETENDEGNYVLATFSTEVNSLNNKGTCSYTISYKKTKDTEYTTVNLPLNNQFTVSNGTYIFEADVNSSYDVMMTATDPFSTVTRSTSASTAFTLMDFHGESGTGMAIGKIAETPNLFDIALPTKFNTPVYGTVQGLDYLPPLASGTNLNDVFVIGSYSIPSNAIAETITNIPIQKGGKLIVSSALGSKLNVSSWAYLDQEFIPYHPQYPSYRRSMTRDDTDTWILGDWIMSTPNDAMSAIEDIESDISTINGKITTINNKLSPFGTQKVLWGPSYYYMSDTHEITLSEAVSAQPHGIVLVFSAYYDGAVRNESFSSHFVPKKAVELFEGYGFNFALHGQFANGVKYLYIHDTKIKGNQYNTGDRTIGSITLNNSYYVLRCVIGV